MNQPVNLPARHEPKAASLTLHQSGDLPLLELAEFAGRSNFFNCSNQGQAVMKLLMGKELGFSPCASLSGLHIVEGRPMVGSNMYASAIRKHANYDYEASCSSSECVVDFFWVDDKAAPDSPRRKLGSYSMTIKDANMRGLTHSRSGKEKANWKNHPDAMLFARCISQGARFHCPDVFGGMAVYTEGEIESEHVEAEVVATEIDQPPEELPQDVFEGEEAWPEDDH